VNLDYTNGDSEQEMRGKTALVRDQNSCQRRARECEKMVIFRAICGNGTFPTLAGNVIYVEHY
jgi:hypothetical protein